MAIALVTGASRGIGKATALLLAKAGYTVAVNYRHNIVAATAVVNAIAAQGGKALALRADVGDEAQVMAMFSALDREGEPLASLVNNAGILFQQSRVEDLTAARINQVLSTNVTGYFLCCREAVKR
ncbi:TPA: SDR family NAD(P)-dependent oxidoreductase, partial [Pluralibacter gergoviae]|nr:SDR family NAD(P)-dependent oxidoreductase [Pluralibacter gergoviae]